VNNKIPGLYIKVRSLTLPKSNLIKEDATEDGKYDVWVGVH